MLTEFLACPADGVRAALAEIDDRSGGTQREVVRYRVTAEGLTDPVTQTIGSPGPAAKAARRRYGWFELSNDDLPGFDPTKLAMLAGALGVEGPSFQEIVGEEEADGEFTLQVTKPLVEALVTASPDEWPSVADRFVEAWIADLATIPAYGGDVPEHMRPRVDGVGGVSKPLSRLAALARRASKRGWVLVARFAA